MEIVKKTIGEIESLIKTGKTPPSKEEQYYNGNINWYTPGDLDKEKFLGKSNRTITEKAVAENKATILPKHTVVIGAIGDIGKLGITSIESCTNQQITGIRTNEEVYFEYFYYWLKANKQLLRGNAKNAILPILNNKSLRAIKIQFPKNIDDQKRIAKVLSQCEGLIQKRKASIDLLDELLRSTFLEMFGDPVRNEKGWNIVPLSKFGTIDRGVSKHRPRNAPELLNGVHPLIQTGDVANAGTYILDYKQTYSDIGLKQSKKWPAGTLCITIAANIAKTGILTFDACFPDSIVGFVVDSKEATNLYVHHLFSFFQRILEKNAPSAAQKNINLEILRTFKVPQPLIEVQQEFDIIAMKAEALKRQFKQSLQELENLYGSISQRAFNGELDLSKVDISDMKVSKQKDSEEVKEDTIEENFESLKKKTELLEVIEERKIDDSYLSENCKLYINKSKDLRTKIYLLSKTSKINIVDFRNDLIELNKIGEELESEVNEFTAWQIDQHKSVERYISLLPENILDEYQNINLFSKYQFDYISLSLDDYYGIPDDIVNKYGSIENHIMDLKFFFKKYFSKKPFSIDDLEILYNRLVYERGDWFKYEEMKSFIFKELEGDDALLTQTFEEIRYKDEESGNLKTDKKIMLKVIS
ncbi:restriction endonuclease subunit S [Chryseobacterium balustinum]|uniref:EcoKI restriction-modification system protein HsdS n=1 Tax=Chryseobacterium balustinum TaxID=246 RepID=A0AAX2IJN5_9FLAO|nr:restriction endonuclease subunit S [Chryseobacterium balustinum]AZB30573.1 restriction endonuclease subunit S [Chryseobacterium balustinum]SKB49920.1 Restriction endonuclease S subunit [Chryseobacterium balustinum]SQA89009.1 EcoKI restriction-modification system protein HsdS [Chryseobacterium balustinum]